MTVNSIWAIAKYTIIEQIRNRLYLIILFFGGAILTSSLLLGAIAPGHTVKVIFDLGLVALELFGLVTAVFGASTLVLQEIESKTIYLLLTRPLPRPMYIIGRFLGLVVAVCFTMGAMSILHILIMISRPDLFREFSYGWPFWSIYPLLVFMSMGKMLVTAAVALFFSLFATSAVSALVFTGCFWVAGHFGTELSFMINKTVHGPMRTVVHFIAHVLPNFQYFNYRDMYSIPGFSDYSLLGWAWLYGLAYASFFLALSSFLFSRKEF